MKNPKLPIIPLATALLMAAIGCGGENENSRLAEMAERHTERQAEQTRQMAELQREVAEGSRQLVAADAAARKEMVALQREVQAERNEVGQQRDELEGERREIAAQRQRDPIIAASITNLGLLLACLLPLMVALYLLCRPVEPVDDREVAELLLADLVSEKPLLLPRPTDLPAIGDGGSNHWPKLPGDSA